MWRWDCPRYFHPAGIFEQRAHMFVKQFRTGGDRNFGYLLADESGGNAALIDPSFSPEVLVDFAAQKHFSIRYIFNTHGHPDHTNGNERARKMTGIIPLQYRDTEPLSGTVLRDNAVLQLGALELRIIHTPGHTQDSICIHGGDALFTGDTLFVGKVGGTDFGSGARALYHALHEKLLVLPDDTRVYPGHDYGLYPESTIAREKQSNPFLLQPDVQAFIHLKVNWLEYKKKHGIP